VRYAIRPSDLAGVGAIKRRRGTTIVRLEAFDAQQVRGQSGTITAVVNALAKAGIELGEKTD
jgi:hypothetical protein